LPKATNRFLQKYSADTYGDKANDIDFYQIFKDKLAADKDTIDDDEIPGAIKSGSARLSAFDAKQQAIADNIAARKVAKEAGIDKAEALKMIQARRQQKK